MAISLSFTKTRGTVHRYTLQTFPSTQSLASDVSLCHKSILAPRVCQVSKSSLGAIPFLIEEGQRYRFSMASCRSRAHKRLN